MLREHPDAAGNKGKFMKALVVDDSKMMRMAISSLLKKLNLEILEAGDGKEALEKAEENPEELGVVMLDWNMPVMNGYDFLVKLRNDSKFSDTKVIMLTTENQIENVRMALQAGANEYIMKPFTDDMLIEKVKMVVPELA